MSLAHHPSEARLFDYAAGSLDSAAQMVLGAHVHACADCATAVAAAEAVGGVLLEDLAPTPMAADAIALALARIERPPSPGPARAGARPERPQDWIGVPAQVVAALRKRRRIAPGVWVAPVARGGGGVRSYLLGIPAGVSLPHHTHRSWEMTVVLKGAFRDGGETYSAGDFCETDSTVRHHPRVTQDGDCVCLAATQGPLVGLDLVGRVLIPLLGL
ncbi:MAG TPA: ChrR family anti-sigma-E factor [Caulobacteraceae bacterium]|nr:ChrR family anti-sigma-E factor [Caulobacteraceae bacterium]